MDGVVVVVREIAGDEKATASATYANMAWRSLWSPHGLTSDAGDRGVGNR